MERQETSWSEPGGPGETPPLLLDAPIVNLRQVTPWLYRGGQPDLQGLKYLKKLGINTIISLRWWRSVIAEEKLAVAAFGMNFQSIPLNYWTYPASAQIERFLSLLDNPDNYPIFLHCKHGSDRAGLFTAIYRMARQGWSARQAYREMKNCGFHLYKMHHFKWAVYLFERNIKRWTTAAKSRMEE